MCIHVIYFRCVEATQSDYVEFSNFFKTIDRKMSRLCGSSENKQQPPVVSDSHFFRVTFKSNNVYDATGFQAHYQFRSEQSASMLTRIKFVFKFTFYFLVVKFLCSFTNGYNVSLNLAVNLI